MSTPAADAAHASPLRNGAFLALLLYRACSGLSYQVVAVTVGWHIYTITRDPFALGLVGLAEVLPYFCVAPFAGYLVDHSRRRTLGAVACLGLLATALALAGIAHTEFGTHATWPIRDSSRTHGASTLLATAASFGRCVSSPGSGRPRRPTSGTGGCSTPAAPG